MNITQTSDLFYRSSRWITLYHSAISVVSTGVANGLATVCYIPLLYTAAVIFYLSQCILAISFQPGEAHDASDLTPVVISALRYSSVLGLARQVHAVLNVRGEACGLHESRTNGKKGRPHRGMARSGCRRPYLKSGSVSRPITSPFHCLLFTHFFILLQCITSILSFRF